MPPLEGEYGLMTTGIRAPWPSKPNRGETVSEVREIQVTNRQTIPTDAALADEARVEIAPLLEQGCVILNRLRRHGLMVGFNCNMDQYGVHRPGRLDVTRPL